MLIWLLFWHCVAFFVYYEVLKILVLFVRSGYFDFGVLL